MITEQAPYVGSVILDLLISLQAQTTIKVYSDVIKSNKETPTKCYKKEKN